MPVSDHSSAPPAGTRVCASDDVTALTALDVTSENGTLPLILWRGANGLRAYVNLCPHQYLPLNYRGDRLLSACGTRLMCTVHGARFDAETGAAVAGDLCPLDAVPVVEQGGAIWIAAGT